ncbi:hypothetical protein AAC387_Pa03g1002 [Persea americana]
MVFVAREVLDDAIVSNSLLIFGTIRGLYFFLSCLSFLLPFQNVGLLKKQVGKPFEVAAAMAISVTEEIKTVDFNKAVSSCVHVEKERVLRCYELIQQMGLIGSRPFKSASGSVSSVPQSPIGVLDAAACLSYKSDEITVYSLCKVLKG